MTTETDNSPRFHLGRIVATPAAIRALESIDFYKPRHLLARHASGDWGDMDDEDKRANDNAIHGGSRVMSSYNLEDDVVIWIITESDRSVTTILLPEDY